MRTIIFLNPNAPKQPDIWQAPDNFVVFAYYGRMNGLSGYRADLMIFQDPPSFKEDIRWLFEYALHRATPNTIIISPHGEVQNMKTCVEQLNKLY